MKREEQQLLVFLGAPGSGKGSVSRMCVEGLGWAQLSTGDLCRKHLAEGTSVGKQIDFAMKSGILVSDNVIIDMVIDWLEKSAQISQVVIFDGFPRTVVQAKKFFEIIKQKKLEVPIKVVEFQVAEDELISRLSSRLVCSNKSCQRVYSSRFKELCPLQEGVCNICKNRLIQRSDDKSDVIKNRLLVYKKHVDDLKNVCFDEHIGIDVIDGMKPAQEVFLEIKAKYGSSV